MFNDNGAVSLYYDNSKKFETTSGGVAVTGNLTTSGDITTGNNGSLFLLDNAGQKSAQFTNDDSTANSLQIDADPDNSGSGTFTAFRIDNSEKVRIDSSGNLMVGTTDSTPASSSSGSGISLRENGSIEASRDGSAPLFLNRETSDGKIIDLYKDGATVGNISTAGGDLLLGTNNLGIRFYDSINAVVPINIGTTGNEDNTKDLGNSAVRWKDLYLGGGLYVGGTGTANKLDDYEEGTWTPQVQDSSSNNASMGSSSQNFGDYVRVGKMVFLTARVQVASNSGLTGSNRAHISGLPFTGINQRSTGAVNFTDFSLPAGASDIYLYFEPTTDKFQMYVRRTGNTSADFTVSELGTTTSSFGFSATYIIG